VREVEEAIGSAAPYQGNQTDLMAAVAVVVGAAALLSFCGFSYCLPVVAGIMGFVVLLDRKKSLDPDRTRSLGAIGIGLSIASFLPFLLFFCMFLFFMSISVATTTISGP
jgi:hypothetical protein